MAKRLGRVRKLAAGHRQDRHRALTVLLAFVFVLSFGTTAHATGAQASAPEQLDSPPILLPGDAPQIRDAESLKLPELKGYNTQDGEWIQFSYHPSVLEKVQPLIEVADEVRAELSRRLGKPVLNGVQVRIARTPREMRALAPSGIAVPSYAAGVAYSQIGLVLLTVQPLHPNSNHDLVEIFRHELVHLALYDAVDGKPVPRWFNEGFAVQASGENRGARLWTLWSATLAENLIPLRRLERSFPSDPTTASIAYAEAADVVRFLLRAQDDHRFRAAMERIRDGQSFDSAISDAYGTDVMNLEYEWREDVARRYTFWPVFFSGTVVWVGVIGLLVWAWRRRRARADVTLARWAREEAIEDARQKVAQSDVQPRVHIVLARSSEPGVPELHPELRDADVPKVEHDGRWHTLH